jgi:hypothetical protein
LEIIPFSATYLLSMAPILLTFLVFLVGFILVLMNRKRLGKATGLAAAGLGVLALGELLTVVWYVVSYNLPRIMAESGLGYHTLSLWYALASLILGLLHLLGFLLLLVSVFAGRPPAAPTPPAAPGAPYATSPAAPFGPPPAV